jgi:hypothetical protein
VLGVFYDLSRASLYITNLTSDQEFLKQEPDQD